MAWGPFFFGPRPVGMDLDDGAVQRHHLELHAHALLHPQAGGDLLRGQPVLKQALRLAPDGRLDARRRTAAAQHRLRLR